MLLFSGESCTASFIFGRIQMNIHLVRSVGLILYMANWLGTSNTQFDIADINLLTCDKLAVEKVILIQNYNTYCK